MPAVVCRCLPARGWLSCGGPPSHRPSAVAAERVGRRLPVRFRVAFRAPVRVTGSVLPVLAYQRWQVETVELDLGTGLGEWIEIRHAGRRWYAATVAERDAVLREYGVDPRALVEVDAVEDGCE